MEITSIRPIPNPPVRKDAPADFAGKADAFVASFPGLVADINAFVAGINPLVPQLTSITANATRAEVAAKAAQEAQALAEAAAGYPTRLGMLQSIALCF